MQRVIRACCACAPKGAAKPLVLLVTAGQRHEVTQLGRLLDEFGVAVTGELTGQRLQRVAIQLVAWRDFRAAFPAGRVLSRDTGHRRPYGENPYPLYDRRGAQPFLFDGRPHGRLAAVERVLGLSQGDRHLAVPYTRLADQA